MKYTPGLWTVDPEDSTRVEDCQGCTVARTDYVKIEEEKEWQENNARLIAAAPRLLYALQLVTQCLENWVDLASKEDEREYDYEALATAHTVISELKGEQNERN